MSFFTDEDQKAGLDAMIEKAEPKVKDFIELLVDCYRQQLIDSLDETESPIERLMAVALSSLSETFTQMVYVSEIKQQHQIVCQDKTFRVDFYIYAIRNKKEYKLVIECDGHDYHERTEKQAQKDKERDRLLQLDGYNVFRFTGSEIVRTPIKCAREALSLIIPEMNPAKAHAIHVGGE